MTCPRGLVCLSSKHKHPTWALMPPGRARGASRDASERARRAQNESVERAGVIAALRSPTPGGARRAIDTMASSIGWMSSVSLLLVLSTSPAAAVTCETDADCSLNGLCKSGAPVHWPLHTTTCAGYCMQRRLYTEAAIVTVPVLECTRTSAQISGWLAGQAAAIASHPGRPPLPTHLDVDGWILYQARNWGATASLLMCPRGEVTPSSSKESTTSS